MKHLFRDPIITGFAKLLADLDAPKETDRFEIPRERRRNAFDVTTAEAESRLAALSAEYASNPLPDCSALMKREGEYEGNQVSKMGETNA